MYIIIIHVTITIVEKLLCSHNHLVAWTYLYHRLAIDLYHPMKPLKKYKKRSENGEPSIYEFLFKTYFCRALMNDVRTLKCNANIVNWRESA